MNIFRDLFCLEFEDVTFLKLNAMDSGEKTKLSPKATEKLKGLLESSYKVRNMRESLIATC